MTFRDQCVRLETTQVIYEPFFSVSEQLVIGCGYIRWAMAEHSGRLWFSAITNKANISNHTGSCIHIPFQNFLGCNCVGLYRILIFFDLFLSSPIYFLSHEHSPSSAAFSMVDVAIAYFNWSHGCVNDTVSLASPWQLAGLNVFPGTRLLSAAVCDEWHSLSPACFLVCSLLLLRALNII